jgi:hypothetical protein
MLHGATTFATVAITAVLLGLLEPIFAAVDAERLLLIFLLLACLRSPLWLVSLCGIGRMGKA